MALWVCQWWEAKLFGSHVFTLSLSLSSLYFWWCLHFSLSHFHTHTHSVCWMASNGELKCLCVSARERERERENVNACVWILYWILWMPLAAIEWFTFVLFDPHPVHSSRIRRVDFLFFSRESYLSTFIRFSHLLPWAILTRAVCILIKLHQASSLLTLFICFFIPSGCLYFLCPSLFFFILPLTPVNESIFVLTRFKFRALEYLLCFLFSLSPSPSSSSSLLSHFIHQLNSRLVFTQVLEIS